MSRTIAIGACFLLAVALSVSIGTQLGPRDAGAAEPTTAAGSIALEPGKSYTFSWPQGPFVAEVVEKPQGHWVKVKRPEDKVGPYWFNLDTILYIRQEPEAKK